jgi:hypothetical protein
MNMRTRLRIKLEAWRESSTFWLVVVCVGVPVVLWLAMWVVS